MAERRTFGNNDRVCIQKIPLHPIFCSDIILDLISNQNYQSTCLSVKNRQKSAKIAFYKSFSLPVETPAKKKIKNFLLHQNLRLEISWGPLGVKQAIQAHLGVENPEKHTFEQNCPKYDATVKRIHFKPNLFSVMIQTLKKDFSRFEEIQILRTVSVEEQKQAPVVKKLDREIKRTLRKKRKESCQTRHTPP